MIAQLDSLLDSLRRKTETSSSKSERIAVLFSIVIAVILSRNITIPLIQGISVARNIASGNLEDITLNIKRHDELGELAGALDIMAIQNIPFPAAGAPE